MNKVNFNYSLKNIPLPNKDTYRKKFNSKSGEFYKKD